MAFAEYFEVFFRIMFGVYELLIRSVFRLIYGKNGQKMPPITNLILLESATSLARKIRTQKLSSLEVTNSFIDRINEINPLVNCLVANRFDKARKEAESVDKLIGSGTIDVETLAREKPFLGVPFTTKDCIAVKGLINSSGLYKRKDVIAEENADVIEALENAGAIVLGLTNVSELCMWWESSNTLHGRTSNPYNTNHIVGGSSGGEGCMQAAAGAAFGIGSDIGGSIRMPAFFNGVFGHKPSKFMVSNKGQYPIPVTKEQDSFLGIGPMCRRAEDLLPILKILSRKHSNELKLDEAVDVKKLRYFYQDSDTGALFISPVNKEIKEFFRKISTHFEKAYRTKMQRLNLKKLKYSREMWLYNMKSGQPRFQEQLANLEGSINLPWELLKWFLGISNHTLIGLCTACAEKLGPGYGSPTYHRYVEMRDVFRREITDMLGDDGVLLYPTHPTPAPYHNEPLFKPFNFAYTGIINVLQLPATHIPLGLNEDGLPIGIQVIANDRCDRLCLAVARELEKAFGGWIPPEIHT